MKGLWIIDEGWLEAYDPDGGDPDVPYPTGTYTVTMSVGRALQFADAALALSVWKQQSARTPLRPDGKPNRPLAARSAVVADLPDD